MYIHSYALECALGRDLNTAAQSLTAGCAPAMRLTPGFLQNGRDLWLGHVDGPLPPIPEELSLHRSRNNQLLLSCLRQIEPQVQAALGEFGPARVGVVIGTSTSGLSDADRKVVSAHAGQDLPEWHYQTQEMGDPAIFAARYLGCRGPAYTVSTACSSSSRALISALRLLQADFCDVVVAGGADTLSRVTVNGFNALGLVSPGRCTPFAAGRDGINIGEAAALMLLCREPGPLRVRGYGESSDAHHISAPHPEGLGARRAMEQALTRAGIEAQDLAYINLHGTASQLNDQAEAAALHAVTCGLVPCSSTKYLTGHTLGASGMLELCLCALLLERQLPLPAQDFSLRPYDDSLPPCGIIRAGGLKAQSALMMSNAFAFGGNNTSVILEYRG